MVLNECSHQLQVGASRFRCINRRGLKTAATKNKQSKNNDMTITLNGARKEIPDGMTVTGLLDFLNIQRQRVAVELNLEIVKKDKFDMTAIKEGDSLEVVSFMAGGN
jgi:sulfur carrier protein